MGPEFVVVAEPVVGGLLLFANGVEEPGVEDFLAEAAVESLMKAFWLGLPGWMNRSFTLCSSAQSTNTWAVSSGPEDPLLTC